MCSSPRYPQRPPRITLFQGVRPFYFLTLATYRRRALLANKAVHEAFSDFAQRGLLEHNVAVGRYVLMPDHLHVFVSFPEAGCSLVRWAGGLKRHLGRTLAKTMGVSDLWQPGFFDHVLRNHESYTEKWEYVRLNPVRAGLCAHPEEWLWQGEIIPLRY